VFSLSLTVAFSSSLFYTLCQKAFVYFIFSVFEAHPALCDAVVELMSVVGKDLNKAPATALRRMCYRDHSAVCYLLMLSAASVPVHMHVC